ncbi:hypothetical protein L211DRAFT_890331 [Terfezia boudieri ATCC MYA-4762]|uniref:Uncharacterized protein n=1 Tax=Terfezia boudieri ATCC MYA-4762 TaxID=1051890 RepID=A0A3N4LE02_9PEZI|nr:hypothetical protein L211DRAFT_890331 [Terfezia boudieri ATCC MYA-4762]
MGGAPPQDELLRTLPTSLSDGSSKCSTPNGKRTGLNSSDIADITTRLSAAGLTGITGIDQVTLPSVHEDCAEGISPIVSESEKFLGPSQPSPNTYLSQQFFNRRLLKETCQLFAACSVSNPRNEKQLTEILTQIEERLALLIPEQNNFEHQHELEKEDLELEKQDLKHQYELEKEDLRRKIEQLQRQHEMEKKDLELEKQNFKHQ